MICATVDQHVVRMHGTQLGTTIYDVPQVNALDPMLHYIHALGCKVKESQKLFNTRTGTALQKLGVNWQ